MPQVLPTAGQICGTINNNAPAEGSVARERRLEVKSEGLEMRKIPITVSARKCDRRLWKRRVLAAHSSGSWTGLGALLYFRGACERESRRDSSRG